MSVDDGTQKSLEEVKKGKPRRFVMICKGAKIVSMIVFKKGTIEKYKKQAVRRRQGTMLPRRGFRPWASDRI